MTDRAFTVLALVIIAAFLILAAGELHGMLTIH